jgi:superfamily II DNA or RNA helicase
MELKFDWDVRKRKGIVSGDMFDEIREHFSVINDAARFARMRGRWCPSRTYAVTPTGRFDLGMYYEMQKYITQNQYKVDIQHTESFTNALTGPKLKHDGQIQELDLQMRDYQHETVSQCLRSGHGTVSLATGGGKTLIMANLLENIFKNKSDCVCVVIVPDLGLVDQTYEKFKQYNVSFAFSKWTGSNELNLGVNVVITNLGIIQSSKSDTDWMHYIDILLIDEVHKLRRGNKINKLIDKIETPHKFGFTGTMPEDLLDQWNIIGKIGPIIYDKNSYELRKRKFISNVKVQVLKIGYNDKPDKPTTNNSTAAYRSELNFIAHNTYRNNILATLCNNFDNNALIMVDYLDHGEHLHNFLQNKCPDKDVYYIRGEVEIEERNRVRELMEQKKDIIVVAISKIFSTGVDIKNLHYIIFASGGKAKIKIIQSIGRGLRLHKDKEELIIFDIADKLKYGLQHLARREQFYKNESITYGTQTINQRTDEDPGG